MGLRKKKPQNTSSGGGKNLRVLESGRTQSRKRYSKGKSSRLSDLSDVFTLSRRRTGTRPSAKESTSSHRISLHGLLITLFVALSLTMTFLLLFQFTIPLLLIALAAWLTTLCLFSLV